MHYRVLLISSKEVSGLPETQTKHEGIFKGCAQGNSIKKTFPSRERKEKGIMSAIDSDFCGPCHSSH